MMRKETTKKELISRAFVIAEQAVGLKLWDNTTGLNFVKAVKEANLEKAKEMIEEWETENEDEQ